MKIALVFFGQPRFIKHGLSSLSHKFFLRGQHYDVFGHCWFDSSAEFEVSPWTGIQNKSEMISPNTKAIIEKQFPNSNIVFESPRQFRHPDLQSIITQSDVTKQKKLDAEYQRLKTTPSQMYNNTTSQLYSMHMALNQVRKANLEYDILMLTRWDNFIVTGPKLGHINKKMLTVSNLHNFGFPDLLFIGPQKLIYSLDAYPNIEYLYRQAPSMTCEHVKKLSFLDEYSLDTVLIKPLNVKIIRHSSKIMFFKELLSHSYFFTYIKNMVPLSIKKRIKILIRLIIKFFGYDK
jgi:hypothetical protein